uniref:peptidylprolyl isomerase n=1 Tax=Setaria italica TaxID=4555 RepID=K4A142_SETIT
VLDCSALFCSAIVWDRFAWALRVLILSFLAKRSELAWPEGKPARCPPAGGRASKIPESEFTSLPNGLKYALAPILLHVGFWVHYVAKWKGITFMTSRQGLGVGGGTPYGFDVGNSERGNVLKGLDLGVEGMKVGGQLDVELLSIKQSPFGTPVKIVEG